MIFREQLNAMRELNIDSIASEDLIDLENIQIDTTQPREKRVESFFEQIKNPYIFRVDDIVVKVNYGENKQLNTLLGNIFSG